MGDTIHKIVDSYIENEKFYGFEIVNADNEDNNIENIIQRYNLLNESIISNDRLLDERFDAKKWLAHVAEKLNLTMDNDMIAIPREYTKDELRSLKKRIKDELSDFDRKFEAHNKCKPSRIDKEPLKSLCTLYKKLKDSDYENGLMELNSLRKKKCELRELLESYQDGFLKENNRKVLYHKDLLPIESEYIEYKSIKNKIKQLEISYK